MRDVRPSSTDLIVFPGFSGMLLSLRLKLRVDLSQCGSLIGHKSPDSKNQVLVRTVNAGKGALLAALRPPCAQRLRFSTHVRI